MKIKDGFEITQDSGSIYIVRAVGPRAEEFPQAIQMGMSGAFLWDLMSKNDCSRAELIFRLENLFECETSTEQVAADVDVFLSFLRENNLLEQE